METPQPPVPQSEQPESPLPPPSLSPQPDPPAAPPPPPAEPPAAAPANPSTLYGAAPPPPPSYPPAPPYGSYPVSGYGQPPPSADGPAPGLRYAGFGIRAGAYLIDAVLLFIVGLIVSPALGGFSTTTNVLSGSTVLQTTSVNGAYQLFEFLLSAIYFIGFWTLTSRTPGMMLLHLRVLRASDGKPIGIGLGIVRWVGLFISFAVIFIGVIWVAIDPRRQGWHDKMAGTFVVQEVSQ